MPVADRHLGFCGRHLIDLPGLFCMWVSTSYAWDVRPIIPRRFPCAAAMIRFKASNHLP